MARGRMISKSLSTSTKFNRDLPGSSGNFLEFAQLLFCMIQPHADDFGRLDGDPLVVKAMVLPLSKRSESHFSMALDALKGVGLIEWYEVDGKKYIQINQFERHQQGLHKRTRSQFPELPGNSGGFLKIPSQEKRTEEKGKEQEHGHQAPSRGPCERGGETPPADDGNGASPYRCAHFRRVWNAYPRKVAKGAAYRAWRKIRTPAQTAVSILAALQWQGTQQRWREENGKFVPHLATYLSQRRWEDERVNGGSKPPTPPGCQCQKCEKEVSTPALLMRNERTGQRLCGDCFERATA